MKKPNPHLADELLNEYLDGALAPDQVATVEAHLNDCVTCQAALETLQRLFIQLEGLEDLPLSRDLTPQVLSRLPLPAVSGWPIRWVTITQVLIAAAVMVFSWPLINPLLEGTPLPELSVEQWLANWQAALTSSWSSWGQSLDLLMDQALAGLLPTSALPWSGLNVWPWIAVLGIFWLLVNGWVLRPMFPGQRNGI